MNSVDQDLDDSALCTFTVIQKRKATCNVGQKKPKQAKLDVLLENNEEKQSCQNLNESTSSYFCKKTTSTCPLCLKIIDSQAGFMTHTKSCAKKHNMTTQELLKALDLQKKHMNERKELGLSSEVVPWNKKIMKAKSDKNFDSYDVALGIALSKSLEDAKPGFSEKGKATLEEFGFKTTQVPANNRHVSRRNKLLQKSILKTRTSEERQKIITEKVAVVLLDEDAKSDIEIKTTNVELNKENGDFVNKIPRLWNLGENEEKYNWYIEEIKPLILTEEQKILETCKEEKNPISSPKNIQASKLQLNLPSKNLSEDWRKMINNRKFSDLMVRTKDLQTVHLHSLVLQTRCAKILEKDFKSVFEKFNILTVLIFLEFLYCGTLNTLIEPEVKNLSILGAEFEYEELINVLNCLEAPEDVRTPQADVAIIESNPEIYTEDRDLFVEDMIDLTQSSRSTNDEKGSEDESNIEKSYWSFIQQEKEREEELRKEEENENSLLCIEREKIETNVKQRDEQMQKIMEIEEESDFRDSLELERICGSQRSFSPIEADKENISECIILSSDSETRWSKLEIESDLKIQPPLNLDYEIPFFDPFNDMVPCSEFSPVDVHSESLISGNILCEVTQPQKETEDKPGYCSTPVISRKSKVQSSNKKAVKKRRSDLSANRIIRKSLNLQPKRTNSLSVKKKFLKKKSINEKESIEVFPDSAFQDLSKSFPYEASTSQSLKNFVEITPMAGKDEFKESVTPSPNFSKMDDSVLKEHLSRYGLKKSIGKNKAKKILRHIYEELHPRINTKTGKIVKMLHDNSPTRKKIKSKKKTRKKAAEPKPKSVSSSEETLKASDESLRKSMDDSNESEFEDLNEPLTQSIPNNPVDLPTAFLEFIKNNSEFHMKILHYEPIWLEDLQSRLKEMFKKHFKLSDLMDFLDQKCITFRTHAQRKVNQKRTEKKKSPRKKTLN